jgi:tetratricopeptide (TPR) repeat protein
MATDNYTTQGNQSRWHQLQSIRKNLVEERDLGLGLQRTSQFLTMFSRFPSSGMIDDIENDYVLMRDFMLKGYQDNQRPQLYHALLERLFRYLSDAELACRQQYDATMSASAWMDKSIDMEDVRRHLEEFVSEAAMISLEPDAVRSQKHRQLYADHLSYMKDLFDAILASPQWSHDTGMQAVDVLTSPTVDTADVQMLVSALMLSAMNIPDPEKVMALLDIYRLSADARVRQRALIGWVFALDQNALELFEQVRQKVQALLDSPAVRQELQELQMQVVYCQNAERDNARLRNDIMPTLLKNQNLEITRFGIKEKMDDPLEDILHPDADDRKMEALEESIRKMNDMRKQGADIYFGGFSQMKRFPFFYTLCNWFMPFTLDHPQLAHLPEMLRDSVMIKQLFSTGPFCDSDKFSFALGLTNVFGSLPDNIRQMLLNGEARMEIPGSEDLDQNAPSVIRRMYLQDLYRFFKLSDRRHAFADPFASNDGHLFMDQPLYKERLANEARNVQMFLLRQERYASLKAMLEAYYDAAHTDDLMMKATLAMHDGDYLKAQATYALVCERQPEHTKARKGYALSSFYAEDYHDAAEQYQLLARQFPDNRKYALNLAISLINDDNAEEGVKVLYQLIYNYPEDLNIKRAMAWGQLWLQHVEQADKYYEEILASSEQMPADFLNAAYGKWFAGNIVEAVALLKNYLDNAVSSTRDLRITLTDKFAEDHELLSKYNIPAVECKLMVDLVMQLVK